MTEDNLKDLLADYDDENDPRLKGYPEVFLNVLRYIKQTKGTSIKKQLDDIDKEKRREAFNNIYFSNEDRLSFKSEGGKHDDQQKT